MLVIVPAMCPEASSSLPPVSTFCFPAFSHSEERSPHLRERSGHIPVLTELLLDFIAGVTGIWVAQSVKHPISAQVMISLLVSSSPTSGSVLTAQSLEPASDSVSPSLSAPSLFMLCLSLSQK